MYTTTWCVDCRRAKWFLKAQEVPFEEINIEQDRDGAAFVSRVNDGRHRVPTFELGDKVFHCSPYNAEKLARELGLREHASVDDADGAFAR